MTSTTPKHHDVIVIGAGFSGLGMGIQLKRAGRHDFLIVEHDVGVGGTWHSNRYPGAACDTPSLVYSFSFAPNPNWTSNYSGQAEIESYLNDCVQRFGLASHLRLRTTVTSLEWDAAARRWRVQAEDRGGDKLEWTARVVVNAAGGLSRPVVPDFPGLAEFAGEVMHTARWKAEVPIANRRIGVVGTGASAIQVVPEVARTASKLVLFQRTPAWVVPRWERPFSRRQRWIHEHLPWLRTLARGAIFTLREMTLPVYIQPGFSKLVEPLARLQLKRQVKDPVLREALTPRYRVGCNRLLVSSDFYPAMQRHNVKLATSPIARVVRDGIVTADGEHHALDVLVMATGFHVGVPVAPFVVRGRDGIELRQVWQGGASAYLGTTVPGFPNLFLLVGPNTALGHNSALFMIESQLRYVMDALARMDQAGVQAVDAKRSVAEAFGAEMQRRLQRTVWNTGGCTSWYRARDGVIRALWPGSTLEFRRRTSRFRLEDYEPLDD
jgi:cation diffusion facilitator CzcD-associated flavoprotein CzcO